MQVESDVSRLNGTETPTNRIVENSFLGRLQARSDDYRTRTRLWLALRKQETEAKLGPRWHQFTATISQSLHRAKQKILGWTESVK